MIYTWDYVQYREVRMERACTSYQTVVARSLAFHRAHTHTVTEAIDRVVVVVVYRSIGTTARVALNFFVTL